MVDLLTRLLHRSALLRVVFLLVAWLAVWQLGRLVEYTEHASVWFPAAGLTFAALLVLGRRAALPLMAAAVLITIWAVDHYQLPLDFRQSIRAGILFGVAHIAPYWLGAFLIGRLARKASHSTPQLIVTFLVTAGLAALCATVLVIAALVITNQLDPAAVSSTLLPFWIGDVAGVVVLAPLFSGWLIRLYPEPDIDLAEFTRQGRGSFKGLANKLALNSSLVVATMLLAYLTEARESSFAIFFLAITHMWIACTESPAFSVVSLAVTSFLIALLVHLLGLMEYVMVYQFAINVIAANALFGIAIPQLRAHNEQLKRMVFTDSLTGASSRHYMDLRASLEITQSHAENKSLSLAVFDLDNFKKINDRYGHTSGDDALVSVCIAARNSVRRQDVIARYGGDEFVILLPDLDQEEAMEVARRIKVLVNRIRIGGDYLRCSLGVAELLPGEDFRGLFQRADEALYNSKKHGGNRITQAEA
ncbi:MAG: diguanylate cyclase [Wenzhouxiangellaceae bacterium]|nr:diguanylate cyclase [Wenzhouxiangellaceae bacterium]